MLLYITVDFGVGLPMYISNFQRWGNSIDTATAYSSYMNGNGMSSSLIPSLNVSAAMLKDGVIQSQYSLFYKVDINFHWYNSSLV